MAPVERVRERLHELRQSKSFRSLSKTRSRPRIWYEERQLGLGDEFLTEVDRAVQGT